MRKTKTHHLEVLTEEPSMEAFLQTVLTTLLPAVPAFSIHSSRGKTDLLRRLRVRLRGYANWMPENFG